MKWHHPRAVRSRANAPASRRTRQRSIFSKGFWREIWNNGFFYCFQAGFGNAVSCASTGQAGLGCAAAASHLCGSGGIEGQDHQQAGQQGLRGARGRHVPCVSLTLQLALWFDVGTSVTNHSVSCLCFSLRAFLAKLGCSTVRV